MMKPGLFISFMAAIVIFGGSCQKEVSPDILNDTATINTTSLLRRIKVHHPSAIDPLEIALSFQYDTAGKKLNIYLDDTTTTNPFDLLAATYQFDANGYLVNSSSIDFNGTVLTPDYTILRNGNGQIQKIIDFDAEEVNNIPYNDTIYFSYNQTGSQMMIQDSVRYYPFTSFSTRQTTYNPQNKVTSENYLGWNFFTYKYNSNGNLSQIVTNTDTTDFIYDNTPVANEWGSLPLLLLGKDYNILQQLPLSPRLSLTFLTFIMEPEFETEYNPLLTRPLAKIVKHGLSIYSPTTPVTKNISFTTTYTADKFPATIAVLPAGEDPTYYTFEYK